MLTGVHELRNLHNAICGWAQIGAAGKRPALDCFEIIARTVLKCEAVIVEMMERNRDVLQARLCEGAAQRAIEKEAGRPIDLNAIARTSKDALEGACAGWEKHLLVKLDLQESLPSPCRGDCDALFRCVYNLCLNARNAGAKRIALRTRALCQGEDCVVWLSVHDDGRGMTAEKLREILDGKVEPTHEHGRGMSIARSCIADLGGELFGESTPGLGSIFTIKFTTGTKAAM
ncbi:MAG TPA: HAMP domain-containing sensor histidine kinase [Chthoniobacterales bacterium]|jgi:signal transduction histidine kinase|nr:HAMP domain-containing sensor histidine kinase [Chthoniobacterales bacterium]